MPRKYRYVKQSTLFRDPTGPGSPAWEQSDLAVILWVHGKHREAGAAMSRMIRLLKAQGLDQTVINQWKMTVHMSRLDPEEDHQ